MEWYNVAKNIFYVAVREYYSIICESCGNDTSRVYIEYRQRYYKFLSQLLSFLTEYNMYNSLVTESEFKIYLELFKVKSQEDITYLKQRLSELSFLDKGEDIPYYMKAVRDYIRKVDI